MKIDDWKNQSSDINFFDVLLARAEKRTENTLTQEQEFVQTMVKGYARQGDAFDVSEAQMKRLRDIAGGGALKVKRAPVAKKKAKAKKAKKPAKRAANG